MTRNSFKYNLFELIIRISVFACTLGMYFAGWDIADMWRARPFKDGVTVIEILWALMMSGIVVQFIPSKKSVQDISFSKGRQFTMPESGYDRARLKREVSKMNFGAKKALAFWLIINGAVSALYFTGILSGGAVILVVAIFYLCDSFCMLFWCPLQKFFMKSICCVNCRIFGWGYFLVFGALLLLPGFFTFSLALTSLALLLRWEISYALHPEWFWAGSNAALRCNNCRDKSCVLKKQIEKTIIKKS